MRMPETTSTLSEWLRAYAPHVLDEDRVEAFVDFIDERILAEVPEIRRDPVLVEDLHQSTRSQWIAFNDLLLQDEFVPSLPLPAAGLAQSLARRRHDLGVLLKVYRVAHQGLWDFFTALVADLGPDAPPRDEVLVHLFGHAGRWLEATTERLIEIFYTEREQFSEGAAARQRELVEAILSGDPVDPAEASRVLRHPVSSLQTCLILWVTEAEPGTLSTLRDAAAEAARALSAPPPLIVVAGSRELWCWIAHPDGVAPEVALGVTAPVRAAAGIAAPGTGGFRASFEEARAAQLIATRGASADAVVRYADVELLCLLGEESAETERMVRRELGALGGSGPGLDVLRRTALVHLTHGMNTEVDAAVLVVHRNTVRYRLGRAEELLGHPLTERIAQLEIALRYVERFGLLPPA